MSALVLHVRLHDGRYHGEGDWPPSPARLFQALVAGAGLGGPLAQADKAALEWLENQKPPLLAAPLAWHPKRGVRFYMPNNDSDAIAGDPLRMPEIRTATKTFRPYLFDATVPFVYAWPLASASSDEEYARAVCSLAERLYQLGRGIDMAWAWGEVLDDRALDDLLAQYPGRVLRPSKGNAVMAFPCPCSGSLKSLLCRHDAFGKRFRYRKEGRSVKLVFRKPPRPQFQQIPYDSPPSRQLYELRSPAAEAPFAPWPLARVSVLVVRLRGGAVERLKAALPAKAADIERVLVGRKPDGTNDGRPENRVRIIPLPSIGHVHADREIRRVLVEVPPSCPLRADDVHWAFSGLDVVDAETGEIQAALIPTEDQNFLRYYGLEGDGGYRTWRTVTPAALPEDVRRRRIDPARKCEEAKGGNERTAERARAAGAVCQALRHAGVRARVEAIGVQREPLEGNGTRVEPFADGSRFPKERLWHVEIRFTEPVPGSLVNGDGRFLGLGVMAPVLDVRGIHVLAVDGLNEGSDPVNIAGAFRRAVMARVHSTIGASDTLPPFFSGHQPSGAPALSEHDPHLAFTFDPRDKRLFVIAPHILERRAATPDEKLYLRHLDNALTGMRELRAGAAGFLRVRATTFFVETDPLFAPSKHWESLTPYRVTRHVRGVTAREALMIDLGAECRRRGLPPPRVEVWHCRGVSGAGLEGHARLEFDVPIQGPLLLGKNLHTGGGLFRSLSGRRTARAGD